MTRTRAGRVLTVAIVSLMTLGLAACGGGGDNKKSDSSGDSSDNTTTTAKDESSSNTSAAAAETVRTVGKTGWYKGFAVTVDKATLTPGSFGTTARLSLDLNYQNLGQESAQAPRGSLISEGAVIDTLDDTPQVPGQGAAKGTLKSSISVKSKSYDAALDDIKLVYGEAADNQTTIPLAASATVDSVEPKAVAVSGQVTQKQVLVDLVKGSSSASYASGEKGKGILAVQVKISCASDCPASGYAIERSGFSVKTPDGQSLVADQSSTFCCEAVYPGTVFEGPKETMNFKVPLPVKGTYTFTFSDNAMSKAGVAPSSAPITVP